MVYHFCRTLYINSTEKLRAVAVKFELNVTEHKAQPALKMGRYMPVATPKVSLLRRSGGACVVK
jgi:hypothetical protein